MSSSALTLLAASGAKGDPVYVDDVFSTDLWTTASNNGNATITNGLDLSGEGGLIWLKNRNTAGDPTLFDSERGLQYGMYTNDTYYQWDTTSFGFTAPTFSANGYTTGTASVYTTAGTHVGWSFRKAPGFFDIVTYTGNGSNRTISHNLGSVPGVMIVKRTSASEGWQVYHRDLATNEYLELNSTAPKTTSNGTLRWNNTRPTATEFSLGTHNSVNANGSTYVAYLFAHDAQDFGADEDESIIKCGTYTGNGSSTGPTVNLGFEPQWLLIKNISDARPWVILDSMRGIVTGEDDERLYANTSESESGDTLLDLTSTGFQLTYTGDQVNGNGEDYIYVAIRRPHKPAEEFAATDLFGIDTLGSTGDGDEPGFRSTFPCDTAIRLDTSTASNEISSRLTQGRWAYTDTTAAESGASFAQFDYQNGWGASASTASNYYGYMFRRAPGFFDVVCYSGSGSSTASNLKNHNLGVAPELVIIKARNLAASGGWPVYFGQGQSTMYLNTNTGAGSSNYFGYSESPTMNATQFSLGSLYDATNNPSYNYIAYLFASVPGISKVGSYTGTGNNLNVDCGFSSGARLVLIKRTDGNGDWYLYDSARGIVAGNDPYKLLNSNAASVTNTDFLDPLSAGFTVTAAAGVSFSQGFNTSGATYIFLAIA